MLGTKVGKWELWARRKKEEGRRKEEEWKKAGQRSVLGD
jgi:hypothetical protein